jgi:hypothetical protein
LIIAYFISCEELIIRKKLVMRECGDFIKKLKILEIMKIINKEVFKDVIFDFIFRSVHIMLNNYNQEIIKLRANND